MKDQIGYSSNQVRVDDCDLLILGGNKQAVDGLGTPVDKLCFEADFATSVQPTGQAAWTGRQESLTDQAVVVRSKWGE
ncbi:MAG: hypothetical protein R3B74_12005 [Nitrospirales bacterium]|nr:hypothetical protein [Nitrospirales bacterium]